MGSEYNGSSFNADERKAREMEIILAADYANVKCVKVETSDSTLVHHSTAVYNGVTCSSIQCCGKKRGWCASTSNF